MPEGDSVKRSCQRLHAALAGEELMVAELRVPQASAAPLVGLDVIEVVARGKHQLIRLSDDITVHTHLRMDGRWRIVDASARWPGPAHQIRVVLGNRQRTAVGLRLGQVDLLRTRDESRIVGQLGPDLLGADWDQVEALRRLRSAPRRTIGEALLDQRNLAGIGTLYRAETLFLCRVHPRTPVEQVADLAAVVETARRLLQISMGEMPVGRGRPGAGGAAGLAVPVGTAVEQGRGPSHQNTTGYRQGPSHWVFERAGRPCLRCGTLIRREEFGPSTMERLSYWCPRCQPFDAKP